MDREERAETDGKREAASDGRGVEDALAMSQGG